jgi:chromosome segregation ATPase
MSQADTSLEVAEVEVRNVGGIDETTVELPPGVAVLTGRNATNRTSFLRAVMGALGSDDVPLKADADSGEVALRVNGAVYTRTLTREDGTVVRTGDPYLEDPELADLFAFLLESNEARAAIRRGKDLRDIIMRPVDTDAIRAEIESLQQERRALADRLEELEALETDLPELETRRRELTDQIEEKRAALDAKEAEVDEANTDLEESKARREEFQATLDELQETRSELERVRFRIGSQEESLEALRNELDDVEATNMTTVSEEERAEVESEIDQLRSRQQRLTGVVSELQSIVQFNEEMLGDDDDSGRVRSLLEERRDETGDVTDQLLESDEVVCWTCGTEVEKSAIASTVDRLRSLRRDLHEERNELQARLSELQMERDRLEEQAQKHEALERQRTQLAAEIDDREQQLAALREERAELHETVERLEEEVEELPDQDYSEVVSLHKEANQLEIEIQRLVDERDTIDDRIAEIESDTAEIDDLERRRASLDDRLADLRTKVEQIEQEAVDQFNEHMEAILSLLEYENLDRIWIERLQREVKDGRRKAIQSVFELHIVRTTDSGTAYEDTVDHLSESEREVTGFVFALAGYLAHEVYEVLPFMLLDSLEAIDAERIAILIEYLTEYSEYLTVALLPEDAAALSDDYDRITEI